MKKALLTLGCAAAFALPAMARDYHDWSRYGASSWARFDSNRDGVIVAEELRANGIATGPQMQALDTDHNGYLEPREVARVNADQYVTWSNDKFYGNDDFPTAWEPLDRNNDGRIDQYEIQDAGYALTPSMRRLDDNGDNVLTPNEVRNASAPSAYAYDNGYYDNGYYTNNGYSNNNGYYGNNNYYNPSLGYHWSALDLNHNGTVENWELRRAGYNTNNNYNFSNLDLNHDGYVSQYELNRYNRSNGYYGNPGINLNNGLQLGDFFNALNLLRVPGLIR